ncbi:hypothetical protein D3C72_891920 [compost metagenome]
MRTQRAQFWVRLDELIEVATQFFQPRLLHAFFKLVDIGLSFHFTLLLGVVITAAGNHAFTVRNTLSTRDRRRQRCSEILRNLNQLFRAGNGDQPHHQEKRHHCGHKVRISDFPRAMRAAAMTFVLALFDYDDGMGLIFHASSVVVCWFGFFTARTCSSSSMNDGRSLEYRVLRPNSTAIGGA